jgi:hypothetical protein
MRSALHDLPRIMPEDPVSTTQAVEAAYWLLMRADGKAHAESLARTNL